MNQADTPYAVRVRQEPALLWSGHPPLLQHLDIELTERCNNNCIHCYINLPVDDESARRRELTTAQLRDILTQAAGLGALSVRFTGGEPLLRDDFAELYLFARRQGLAVSVFTNARLITPEIADLFARVPPLEKIEVTVYGMKPSSYQAVSRVRGSFADFQRGIALLRERNIPFLVKGVVLPANRHEVDELDAWAATIPGKSRPPSYSVLLDLRCRRDSTAKNRVIRRLRANPQVGLAAMSRNRDEYLQQMREFCAKFIGPPGDRLFTCGAGSNVSVDAYGTLQPCILLRDPSCVYDLGSGSIEDALVNFFPRLRDMRASNAEYLMRCARCYLHGLCERCPAKSWMEHGTLDTPVKYLCDVAHAQARDLGLVREGETAWEISGSEWQERIKDFRGEPVSRSKEKTSWTRSKRTRKSSGKNPN